MIDALSILIALPVCIAAGYLLLLTLLSTRPKAPPRSQRATRFAIVVPAHNEAAGIVRTIRNLQALDWPTDRRRICVVADNCSDDTAAIARAAGAEVLVRFNDQLRGKGYALDFAFEQLLTEGWAEAFVVVDADSEVTPNLLEAYASRIERGAAAIQAFYGVLNPLASRRTRLITIALAIFHRLRGRGRERLSVSAGLRGNGMCFTADTLRRVPHRAFSIVEDLEYGVQLGRAGLRVQYADEASVLGEMVSGGAAAESQRERWEGGRLQMARVYGWPLLRDAIAQRSLLLLDLALDVLVPPLAWVALSAVALWVLGLTVHLIGLGGSQPVMLLMADFCLLSLLLHVARGVVLSGLGARGWLDLATAPLYVLWKVGLLLKRRGKRDKNEWVRTEREKGQ